MTVRSFDGDQPRDCWISLSLSVGGFGGSPHIRKSTFPWMRRLWSALTASVMPKHCTTAFVLAYFMCASSPTGIFLIKA